MSEGHSVYAWGLNALGQVCLPGPGYHEEDVLEPHLMASATNAEVVWASWSDTLVLLDGTAVCCGDGDHVFFSDRDGLKGSFRKRLCGYFKSISFYTDHVAFAGDGHVAVINYVPKDCSLGLEGSYMSEFATLTDFETWYGHVYQADPAKRPPEPKSSSDLQLLIGTYIGPSYTLQLVPSSTGFTLLSNNGKVMTWGDARYPQCLGRPLLYPEDATTPAPVPYLSELFITKIASGGWMSGAISSEEYGGELYIWGQSQPGSGQKISLLKQNDSEDQHDPYVCVANVKIDGEDAKVFSFGIGGGHLLVAATSPGNGGPKQTAVFACGTGGFGQLGLGERVTFLEELTEIRALRGFRDCQVVCGPKTSFLVAKSQNPAEELATT